MKAVLATNNNSKLNEFKAILGDKFDLVSLKDLNINVEVEEDGCTFFENALKKAKTIAEITGMPALSDDSGLVVKALNGAPGIYSARYAGEHSDDSSNRRKVLFELGNEKDRTAYFYTCLVLYFPDGHFLTADGKTEGSILFEERGQNGFGYDSIFFSNALNKSFGEAFKSEKNSASHRYYALTNLLSQL